MSEFMDEMFTEFVESEDGTLIDFMDDVTVNAFCATGQGGGVDPSCSPGSSGGSATKEGIIAQGISTAKAIVAKVNSVINRVTDVPVLRQIKAASAFMKEKTGQVFKRLEGRYGKTTAIAIMASGQAVGWGALGVGATVGVPLILPGSSLWGALPAVAVAETVLQAKRGAIKIGGGVKRALSKLTSAKPVTNAADLSPEEIGKLGQEVWIELKTAFDKYTVDHDKELRAITLSVNQANELYVVNDRWRALADPEKIRAFKEWLKQQLAATLQGKSEEELWQRYVEMGFRKGAGRAFDDTKAVARGALADALPDGKDQFLRQAFAQPVAVDKVRLLASRSFDDLEGVTSEMSTRMTRVLTDGLVQGQSPLAIASGMTDQVDISQARAETIARTEIIRAHAEGQLDALGQMGVEEVGVAVEWNTTGDDAVCELCAPLEGIVLKIDEARGMLPRHPNCVVGDTRITAPSLLAVMSAEYTGPVVEFYTAGQGRLTVTIHHIMLTQRGWVFAKDVKDSDYLVCGTCTQGSPVGPDEDESHPLIRDVFDTAVKCTDEHRILKTPAVPHYFHGDGASIQSEVEVVSTEGKLWDDFSTSFGEQTVKGSLTVRDVYTSKPLGLNGQRGLSAFLKRAGSAADRLVSGQGIREILLGRSLPHHESVGVGRATNVNSRLHENTPDGTPLKVKPLVQGVDTNSAQVELNDLIRGKLVKVERHVLRHVHSLRVYDVSTESTLYVANGFVTSNCRCAWIPANVGEDQSGQKDTKGQIDKAVKTSERRAGDEFSTGSPVTRDRPESIVNRVQPGTDAEEYDFHRQQQEDSVEAWKALDKFLSEKSKR